MFPVEGEKKRCVKTAQVKFSGIVGGEDIMLL